MGRLLSPSPPAVQIPASPSPSEIEADLARKRKANQASIAQIVAANAKKTGRNALIREGTANTAGGSGIFIG